MKTKSLIKTLFLLLTVTLGSSCSKENSTADGDVSLLYNRWWYESNNTNPAPDLFFNSTSAYQQHQVISGVSVFYNGTWTWEDQDQKIMKVIHDSGTGTTTTLWFQFSGIQEGRFKVKQSSDGVTFSNTTLVYLFTNE
ncbi:hypothetical protein [Flavobacterium sp. 102]|uniref:hypothetical protein n=1 Tax=Flavobacterium sp. 102 TaxID=2135623 RepID=UPI0011C35FD7|nr:hypothetical protein [Flavobacterium sp. 102]